MRLHVHDFSGHPFQVELSRALARLGDEIQHSYCSQYVSGKGTMSRCADDPESLSITAVRGSVRFEKYHPMKRAVFEVVFARDLWTVLKAGRPDAVVLCNAPLMTTYLLALMFRRRRILWIYWHQDIYSMGMRDELARKFPSRVAKALAAPFFRMERSCVRRAGSVVAIDEVFRDQYREWGIDTGHVTVVPNWAPLDEIVPVDRDNDWARDLELPKDRFRILYSGTLGRKHNPLLLLRLLRSLVVRGVDAHLTVVSEGDGVEQLRVDAGDDERVTVLGFQPAERLSEVLSSADVLVVILEPEASRFSIPSKVLSYLAAGRPIVGLMPHDNAAANAIQAVGSLTSRPDDGGVDDIADQLESLAADPDRRTRLGAESRAYAEREFDVDRVSRQFRNLLSLDPRDGRCSRSAAPRTAGAAGREARPGGHA